MKNKSILIIAPYGFNDRMTNFIEFVTARLLAKHGWNVTAIARSDGRDEKSEVSGILVHRYAHAYQGIMWVIRILIFNRPTLIHIHNQRNNRVGMVASMIARILAIPLVFTEYGLFHDHYLVSDRDDPFTVTPTYENVIGTLAQLCRTVLKNPKKMPSLWSSYIYHWPLMHAGSVVFVSQHNLAIAKRLGLKNFVLLPQIADTMRWNTTVRDIDSYSSHELKINSLLASVSDSSSALFIGQMKPRKGWEILIRAISFIPPSVLEKFIIVTSSGKEEKEVYSNLVDSLGVRDRILFLGSIPTNMQLKDAFKKSKVVVVPSFYEGFGLVPLEAFEMRIPVVASRVEALTDFLVDGVNAVLVEAKNPQKLAAGIIRVVGNENLQHILISGGKETLATMCSDDYAQKWLSFYSKL